MAQVQSTIIEDNAYAKDQAEANIDALINQFDDLLSVARDIKAGIARDDEAAVREALSRLDVHLDGYWHRIVMSYGTGHIHEYLDSLTWEESSGDVGR